MKVEHYIAGKFVSWIGKQTVAINLMTEFLDINHCTLVRRLLSQAQSTELAPVSGEYG